MKKKANLQQIPGQQLLSRYIFKGARLEPSARGLKESGSSTQLDRDLTRPQGQDQDQMNLEQTPGATLKLQH